MGIGRVLVERIIIGSLTRKDLIARLIIVQAKEDAFEFYLSSGFDFVKETRREKNRFKSRGTRTMFFDLKYLRDSDIFQKDQGK